MQRSFCDSKMRLLKHWHSGIALIPRAGARAWDKRGERIQHDTKVPFMNLSSQLCNTVKCHPTHPASWRTGLFFSIMLLYLLLKRTSEILAPIGPVYSNSGGLIFYSLALSTYSWGRVSALPRDPSIPKDVQASFEASGACTTSHLGLAGHPTMEPFISPLVPGSGAAELSYVPRRDTYQDPSAMGSNACIFSGHSE